ncbi:hypothetical protein VSS74_24490 [Conexibacter stalactiti]|uniref:MarR family transcriptional regulator n=1 Tax=Conexibacter stalactiti TaxID=1940611 RepID=A0ABU4HW27_9ACTN|nr:hypothetical protein [Conexibacter stalactiti]MDW5597531.1 hypothetical protein [Conexibacter stalactiti]MEC5038173.1 hypothetical protein [Conexibacter stalactiti]
MTELLLPRLKQEIETRLAELRPLIAEIEQLEAAKAALLARAELPTAIPAPAPARRRATRNGSATRRRAAAPSAPKRAEGDGERAPRGANRDAIVKLVEERPGVSVAEIASVTKIAKPTVATTVSKLKREGVFADEAGGVKLASRQAMTISGAAPAAAAEQPAAPATAAEAEPAAAAAAPAAAKAARRARRGAKRKPARRAPAAAKQPRRDEGVSDGEWDEAAPAVAEDAAS